MLRANNCKQCGRDINPALGYCVMCNDKPAGGVRNTTNDSACLVCNQRLYMKNAKYCFRCQPKCAECRIMRVEEVNELCNTCLNQKQRE